MATTTNYGWTTPDDTALVKDGASAIRTLGSSIDTTTKNLNPSTTLGDIEYRSATANTNTRLAIGSSGQVLTVAAGVPSWATPAASGGMTLISTTTASGSSVSLTSIAGTYKHLLVVMTDVSTSSTGNLKIQFNSDTTATRYRWTHIRGNGTTLSMVTDYEDAQILVAATDGILGSNLGNLDNTSGAFWVYNYTQNPLKTVWGRVSSITTNEKLCEFDGLYNETAAVSSIQLTPTAGTFSAGDIFLYGVA